MTTSVPEKQHIEDVRTDDRELTVYLIDGRTLSVPLAWHPLLLDASEEQRNDWRLIGGGLGVHWPQIDEDLSLAGMLRGVRSSTIRPGPSSISEWTQDEQYLRQAQDFFAQSMGRIKGRMQNDSAQIESIMYQLPEGSQAKIQEMTDSYVQFEDVMNQAARAAGVLEEMDEAAQQARQSAEEATAQGEEPVEQAAEQAQGIAENYSTK